MIFYNSAQKRAILLILIFPMIQMLNAQHQTLFNKQEKARTISERWELDSTTKRGTFIITPYKQMFVTAGRWSNNPNDQPKSENPAYSLPFKVNYNNYEAKFQISMKVKIFQGIFWKHGDLWVGYTQKSHWQIYNTELSRPFRETNYEPELILNFATNFKLLGLNTKMLGIGFNHQSNGRTLPLSRSWNRIVGQAGFEKNSWTIYLRGWYRLPDDEDENPAICDYIGRGDLTVIYKIKKHLISFQGGHSLRFDERNRGFMELDWSFPVSGNFRMMLQLYHGYGETMIDYNNKQTLIGIAVSLVDWL